MKKKTNNKTPNYFKEEKLKKNVNIIKNRLSIV